MSNGVKYTNMSEDEVYTTIYRSTLNGTYASYIRGARCHTDEDTIREISSSFQFPGYFGENWNAVHDCLGDLEWLNPKKILVIVEDFHKSYDGDKEAQEHLVYTWELMIENQQKEGVQVDILLNN